MANVSMGNIYILLLVCLNAIALIIVFRQACLLSKPNSINLHSSTPPSGLLSKPHNISPRLTTPAVPVTRFWSRSLLRTTEESLYVMYGDRELADDEHLSNYIRSMTSRQAPGGRHLSQPSRVHFSQHGGSEFLDNLLKQRRNGFFVESGAFGGEDLSDTLFFEMQRNWTGILIEPHPEYYRSILQKNRNALVLRACLSHTTRPVLAKFRLHGWGSGVSELNRNVRLGDKNIPETDVQCFSLNSIMTALGVRHIDLMVLDVEGSELPVLKTIDWTKLSVDVFSIEYASDSRLDKLEKISSFLKETGIRYDEVGRLPMTSSRSTAQDVIFMRAKP